MIRTRKVPRGPFITWDQDQDGLGMSTIFGHLFVQGKHKLSTNWRKIFHFWHRRYSLFAWICCFCVCNLPSEWSKWTGKVPTKPSTGGQYAFSCILVYLFPTIWEVSLFTIQWNYHHKSMEKNLPRKREVTIVWVLLLDKFIVCAHQQ